MTEKTNQLLDPPSHHSSQLPSAIGIPPTPYLHISHAFANMASNITKPETSLQDVLGEIEMYQVLLKSAYDSVSPDEALKAEYEEKLATLEQELETLQPLPTWDAISSETSSEHGDADTRSQSTTTTGLKDDLSSTTSVQNQNGTQDKDESNLKLNEDKAYIGNGSSTNRRLLADVARTSPFGRLGQNLPLPTRKRPFSGQHDYTSSKSWRATPSPAISSATSPSSASEFDDLLSTLLGSDIQQDYRDYEKEQRDWDARQDQERRDEELARSIQESWNSPVSYPKPQSFPVFQTSLGSSSGSVRAMPPPPLPQIKAETFTPRNQIAVKSEHVFSVPGSFPNAGFNEQYDNSSSSSLEEISPSSFVPRIKPEPVPAMFSGQSWDNSQSMIVSQSSFTPQYGAFNEYNPYPDFYQPTNYGTQSGYGPTQNVSGAKQYESMLYPDKSHLLSMYESPEDLLTSRLGSSSKLSQLYPTYNDQAKTHEELKNLLANIRPDEEVHPENREGTPEAMKCTLMEHQKLGLTWMKSMEDASSKGGILADDMGLGKTVQALSLIVSRKSENPACKTTLIVAPVALMGQWAREISKLLKRGSHALTIETVHSNTRDLQWSKLREKDVVITTYGTLASEVKRKHAWEEKLKRFPNAKPSGRSEHIPLLGERSKWYRVILDEAQWIKNKTTKTSLAACFIQAEYRWCLTGTPMQNSVDELYSLIRFLRIPPYSSLERFNRDFSRPLKAKNPHGNSKENAMHQLQALLKAIMLRRTKDSKIDGKPILQLPAKTIEEQHTAFSKDEHDFYQALESRAKITFNKYLKAGTVGRNYSNALVLLLRLRQACCHPHLIKDLELETDAGPENIDKLANAETLPANVVERIKQIESFECPICFDAAINSLIFNPCGHPSCNECFDRLATQAHANADREGGAGILCPTCRGKVDPAKLTDFKSFKEVFRLNDEGTHDDDIDPPTTQDDEDTESDSDSDHDESDDDVNDDGDLADFVVPDDEIDLDSDNFREKKLRGQIPLQPQTANEEGKGQVTSQKKKNQQRKGKGKGKGKGKASSTKHLSLAQLRREGLKNKAAKKRYLRRLEKNFQTSSKIEKTVELLEAIEARGTNEKTIVFSQFTSLLDLLEVPLSRKDLRYKRYDGSMKPSDREEAVLTFTDDPRCTVMLVSLKAGNSGLNLTAASQVIIFDPHWNW